MAAIGHAGITGINVATPEFFEALQKAMTAADPATLRAYLRWHAVDAAADLLPQGVRRRQLRLLRQDAARSAGDPAALEAVRLGHRAGARRSRRRALRREAVPRRQQGQGARHDPRHRGGLPGEPAEPRLDGRRHPRPRARQDARDRQQDRLSRPLARLLEHPRPTRTTTSPTRSPPTRSSSTGR